MDFPTIRELSRRKKAVRILKYLMKCSEEPCVTDIWNALDMNDGTALYNLTKLENVGIVEVIRTEVDGRCKYFHVIDRENAERIIERYHWTVAFKLARLIPYTKTEERKVREDKRFIALCEEYYLTLDEGIRVVKNCAKIGVEKVGHPYNKTYLHRKSEGYDEPERTREQILKEARGAIE